jgi:hypothetical protein
VYVWSQRYIVVVQVTDSWLGRRCDPDRDTERDKAVPEAAEEAEHRAIALLQRYPNGPYPSGLCLEVNLSEVTPMSSKVPEILFR